MTPSLHTRASTGQTGKFNRDVTAPPVGWSIVSAEPFNFGALVAAATIEVPGVGRFEVSLFRAVGKPGFTKPRGIRVGDKYVQTFELDRAFAEAIRDAVFERLGITDAPKTELPGAQVSAKDAARKRREEILDRGERGLEEAMASL